MQIINESEAHANTSSHLLSELTSDLDKLIDTRKVESLRSDANKNIPVRALTEFYDLKKHPEQSVDV